MQSLQLGNNWRIFYMECLDQNLGPILFSIYVNDIFNIFEFTPMLYTDDTCFHVKASKEKDLETLINREVEMANLYSYWKTS